MELISLSLRNFKGVREFVLNADKQDVVLAGANATYKSSVADAFTWLLFGKDMQDRIEAKFGIKTRNADGDIIHDIDHEVTGVFEHAGRVFSLRRVYREDWTRKRGSDVKELTGHTTEYFLDDAPVSKSEYQGFVDSIIDEKRFKMLSVPNYFAETLEWKERRAILSEIVGDIDDLAVVASNDSLKHYMSIKGALTHDQAKDRIRAQVATKKESLKTIPARIDEAERTLLAVEDADLLDIRRAKAQDLIKEARARIEDAKQNRSRPINPHNDTINELSKKSSDLLSKRLEVAAVIRRTIDDARNVAQQKVTEAMKAKNQIVDEISALERKIDTLSTVATQKKALLVAHVNHAVIEQTCPSCGQDLPDDKVDAARNAHAETTKRLQKSYDEAKKLADAPATLETIDKLKDDLALSTESVRSAIEARDAIKDTVADDPQYVEITAQIDAVLNELEDAKGKHQDFEMKAENDSQPDTTDDEEIIAEQQDEISKIDKQKQSIEANAKTEQRIEELRTLKDLTASELVKLEQDFLVLEAFERIKSDLITTAVNSHFKGVEFILFRDQLNGGLAPCCDVVFKGVPYSEGLNTAGRIQAGIEIISVLAEHYDVSAPIIVDNRESVTVLPDTQAQIISLFVSPEHTKLTKL